MKNSIHVEVFRYHGFPLDRYADVDSWNGHLVINTSTGNGVYVPENSGEPGGTFRHGSDGMPSSSDSRMLEIDQNHFSRLRKYARESDGSISEYFRDKIINLISDNIL